MKTRVSLKYFVKDSRSRDELFNIAIGNITSLKKFDSIISSIQFLFCYLDSSGNLISIVSPTKTRFLNLKALYLTEIENKTNTQ